MLTAQTERRQIRRGEFVALMAMMFATIAFSIDAMLPALPDIAAELSPLDPQQAALIITTFVLGMGIGTFFMGPLSDAFGRRRVMFFGAILYVVAAAVAWASSTLEVMLIARVFQGIGAAGPRVVSLAIIRDLYSGREMAKIVSLVMMIFTIVPAIAPTIGYVVIQFWGWHGIFITFILFSALSMLWFSVRLPETLPVENRRPIRLPLMIDAVGQMFANPTVRLSIIVQTLVMSMLFTLLMLIQPIYAQVFDRLETFHIWFGVIALTSASASFLNAMMVERFGMRRLVTVALAAQILLSAAMLASSGYMGPHSFTMFVLWQVFVFFHAGLTVGNLNAIALEPMGHIAGMAASVIGAVSTVMAAAIASPIGLLFDGTIRPLVGAILVLATLAFICMLLMAVVEDREMA